MTKRRAQTPDLSETADIRTLHPCESPPYFRCFALSRGYAAFIVPPFRSEHGVPHFQDLWYFGYSYRPSVKLRGGSVSIMGG